MKTITTYSPRPDFTKAFMISLLLLAFTLPQLVNAQCYSRKIKPICFKKGDITLSSGIGLLPTFRGKYLSTPLPPISTILNFRLRKNLSTGIYLGYSLTEANLKKEDAHRNIKDIKTVRNNFYLIGLRVEGHFIRDRADFYGGAMLGYNFSDIDSNLEDYHDYTNIRVESYADVVTWSGHIGFKYLISRHIGVFTEIGYGVSVFVFGATVRI